MKKIMMIAAAAICAVSVQAATFNWGSDWVYATDYDNGTAAGSAWLVMLGTDGVGAISVGDGGVLSLGNNTLVGAPGSVVDGGLTTAPILMSPATYNGRSFVVVGYDSNSGAGPVTQWYGISDVYVMAGLSDTPSPNAISNQFGSGDGTELFLDQPIPEPATMALVGIGAAVVALRKRFAKKA